MLVMVLVALEPILGTNSREIHVCETLKGYNAFKYNL